MTLRSIITRPRLLAAGALAAVLAFRVALVLSWHKTGGDGVQYYSVAQELRRANRIAFSRMPRFSYVPPPGAEDGKGPPARVPQPIDEPPPVGAETPLSYARLPGYPAFLAYVAAPGHYRGLGAHVTLATLWNVALDLATALLVLGIVRARGFGRRAGRVGLVLALACPTLWLMSCYAMTESLATFLGTLEIFCAVRAADGEPGRRALSWAALAGAVAGVAQWVRADAITFAPGALIALASAAAPLRRRLAACALFLGVALAVFAPWPARNQLRFGRAHPFAASWRRVDGTPLGEGTLAWVRTWSSSQPGEAFFDQVFSYNLPWNLERPGILVDAMFDSPDERAQLVELIRRYNVERLSPNVDEGFRRIAEERRARSPWRYYLTLPLKRIARLWSPVPDWEMPIKVAWLALPRARPVFGFFDRALFALALVGAVLLWRRGRAGRVTVLVCAACAAARSLVYGFAVPHGCGGRYLVEVFPLLMVLAAVAVVGIAQATLAWLEGRRGIPAVERALDQVQAVLAPEEVAAHHE
jgi:hypothetical protein